MFWAAPQSAEPNRKIRIATMKSGLRPWTSPSFPYNGTVTVDPSRYAVNTHEYCVIPPRSATTLGSAVATIVWSRAASSSATISPE